MPETAYVRDSAFDTDTAGIENNAKDSIKHDSVSSNISSERKEANATSTEEASVTQVPKMVSKSRLRIFNGRKTNESFFKLLIRPFPLFFHPAILWACLIQGTLIGWTVLIGIVIAAVLFEPPLVFNEVQIGYMYTGAFIGALLGFTLAGLLSDNGAKWMARRNGGIYEPEFRTPFLVVPQLIFGCAGLFGFGIVSANTFKYRWFWPDFFFSLEIIGMVLGAVASALYIVDAHRDIAVEGFTCLLVFKNVFTFGLTFSGFHWFEHHPIDKIFKVVGGVQIIICCSTVLLCKLTRPLFFTPDEHC